MSTSPFGATQEVFLTEVPDTFSAIVLLTTVVEAVAVQSKKSVTVTLYVPGAKLVRFCGFMLPGICAQLKVSGAVAPDTFRVTVPLF